MFKTFLFLIVVLNVIHLKGSHAIKCNLCIGSPNSDCAKAEKAAMAIQNCHTKVWPARDFYHYYFRRHLAKLKSSTAVNDILENSMDSDNGRQEVDEHMTTNKPWFGSDTKILLEPSCVYLKIKESNDTTSLVTRGCGYMPKDMDLCTIVKKLNPNLVYCTSCDTDECN